MGVDHRYVRKNTEVHQERRTSTAAAQMQRTRVRLRPKAEPDYALLLVGAATVHNTEEE